MADDSILEAWVNEQYKEIGFDERGGFIGRSALKEKLISQQPQNQLKIKQLVNSMEIKRKQPKSPQSPKSTPSIKSTVPSQASSPPLTTSRSAGLALELKLRAASTQDTDSGFASNSEIDNIKTEQSSQVGRQSTIKTHVQSLVPEEDGGAILSANPSPIFQFGDPANLLQPETIFRFGQSQEELGAAEKVEQGPSNPKISELKRFLNEAKNRDTAHQKVVTDTSSILDLQLELLHVPSLTDDSGEEPSTNATQNAVLFSADILRAYQDHLPQYGLLGSSDVISSWATVPDSRLFLNTNVPFSAFVCGVQGSGKSHTTACMIENCLIPSPMLGVLQKPLSAVVFNFSEYASAASFRPCELAFLASPNSQTPNQVSVKKVNILVSPSNYLSLKKLYTQIPGVSVQPFMLHPQDLSISTMLTLMSVNQAQTAPLYMGMVTKILRNMAAMSANDFNYPEFRRQLDVAGLDRKQEEFLNQRLNLLESFMDLENAFTRPKFAAGEITIIDLSCPFVDASTACILFKIGMGLYLESDPTIGKVIVLDEAHKYITDTPASKVLTDSLMGVIRQQRHYGARVIISTQEPSVSPKLIDLCSITVMHRFSSPEWLSVLKNHILISDEEDTKAGQITLLRNIMKLKTGEAMVFAPSAILGAKDSTNRRKDGTDELLKMRMRKRVTWDGGKSIVCI